MDKLLASASLLTTCMRRMPYAVIVRGAGADVLKDIREWFAETCGLEATQEDPGGNWLFVVGNGLSRNKRRAESFPARFYVTERRMAAHCKLIWHGHAGTIIECQDNPPPTTTLAARSRNVL
jgi:hypothetical protein